MTLSLRVQDVRKLNPLITEIRLAAVDGAALPGFKPGAHVRVQVPLAGGAADWRHYSLVALDAPSRQVAPTGYTIAVRREDTGRGGSLFMHGLQPGDVLAVEEPRNDFPLHDGPGAVVLLAGGIGVTPVASMAAHCRAAGRPVRMHYAGRSRALMAYLPELEALLGGDLHLHEDAVAGAPLDVDAVLDSCGEADALYVCGPKPLLDAVLEKSQARGWTRERVHFELFTAPVAAAGDHVFELVLSQSGQVLQVGASQTILDCMLEAGCDPMFDCKRGECGVCSAAVLEGKVDHRDYFLSDAEKAEGKVIQICVSRAAGPRLVLDL